MAYREQETKQIVSNNNVWNIYWNDTNPADCGLSKWKFTQWIVGGDHSLKEDDNWNVERSVNSSSIWTQNASSTHKINFEF